MHRLLLVEDDALMVRWLEQMMTRAGYEVRAVVLQPGQDVLLEMQALMHWPADAVLTDGLGGQARQLVALCSRAWVPVAVYTGEPERYADLPVPVLAKPADSRDLLAVVRQLCAS